MNQRTLNDLFSFKTGLHSNKNFNRNIKSLHALCESSFKLDSETRLPLVWIFNSNAPKTNVQFFTNKSKSFPKAFYRPSRL